MLTALALTTSDLSTTQAQMLERGSSIAIGCEHSSSVDTLVASTARALTTLATITARTLATLTAELMTLVVRSDLSTAQAQCKSTALALTIGCEHSSNPDVSRCTAMEADHAKAFEEF